MREWIKVEKCTPSKPEVLAVASELGIDPDAAFGKCFRFWCWCDSHMENGNAKSVTDVTLDFLIGNAGFAAALEKVGWLHLKDGHIVVPNFERHMSKSAKKRAETAKRVNRHRVKNGNANVTQKALPQSESEYLTERISKSAVSSNSLGAQAPTDADLTADLFGSEESRRLAGRLCRKARFSGADREVFDRVAVLIGAGHVSEVTAMEAAQDSANGDKPGAVFRAKLNRIIGREKLRALLARVNLNGEPHA